MNLISNLMKQIGFSILFSKADVQVLAIIACWKILQKISIALVNYYNIVFTEGLS